MLSHKAHTPQAVMTPLHGTIDRVAQERAQGLHLGDPQCERLPSLRERRMLASNFSALSLHVFAGVRQNRILEPILMKCRLPHVCSLCATKRFRLVVRCPTRLT